MFTKWTNNKLQEARQLDVSLYEQKDFDIKSVIYKQKQNINN